MRRFRLLLGLLLCLTVPLSAWASLCNGLMCPEMQQQSTAVAHDDDADADQAMTAMGHPHHSDDHCGGVPTGGGPCKGDHCACGCGFGACTSGLSMLAAPTLSVAAHPGSQAVPLAQQAQYADSPDTRLLRPPIG
jgi:hypothetical protein